MSIATRKTFQKAVDRLDIAVEVDPELAEAFLDRGIAYEELGKDELAIADYSRAIELNPRYSRALYRRALLYRRHDNWAGANADYERAFELNRRLGIIGEPIEAATVARDSWMLIESD